ncbi:hypothetical protein ACA910_007665 [Epithemia clementina (nom. ined.)]
MEQVQHELAFERYYYPNKGNPQQGGRDYDRDEDDLQELFWLLSSSSSSLPLLMRTVLEPLVKQFGWPHQSPELGQAVPFIVRNQPPPRLRLWLVYFIWGLFLQCVDVWIALQLESLCHNVLISRRGRVRVGVKMSPTTSAPQNQENQKKENEEDEEDETSQNDNEFVTLDGFYWNRRRLAVQHQQQQTMEQQQKDDDEEEEEKKESSVAATINEMNEFDQNTDRKTPDSHHYDDSNHNNVVAQAEDENDDDKNKETKNNNQHKSTPTARQDEAEMTSAATITNPSSNQTQQYSLDDDKNNNNNDDDKCRRAEWIHALLFQQLPTLVRFLYWASPVTIVSTSVFSASSYYSLAVAFLLAALNRASAFATTDNGGIHAATTTKTTTDSTTTGIQTYPDPTTTRAQHTTSRTPRIVASMTCLALATHLDIGFVVYILPLWALISASGAARSPQRRQSMRSLVLDFVQMTLVFGLVFGGLLGCCALGRRSSLGSFHLARTTTIRTTTTLLWDTMYVQLLHMMQTRFSIVHVGPSLSIFWYTQMEAFARFSTYFQMWFMVGLPSLVVLPAAIRLFARPMGMICIYWLVATLLRPVSTLFDWNVGLCLVALSMAESPIFLLWIPPANNRMKVVVVGASNYGKRLGRGNKQQPQSQQQHLQFKSWSWTWPWLIGLVAACAAMVPVVLFPLLYSLWLETGNGEANFVFFQCLAFNILATLLVLLFVQGTVQWDKLGQLHGKYRKKQNSSAAVTLSS